MFAHTLTPSSGGRRTRLAPIAGILCVLAVFALSAAVLVEACTAANLLAVRARTPASKLEQRRDVPQTPPGVLVRAPAPAHAGG